MQINRRSFLKSGAALATGAVTGCATAAHTDPAVLRGNADALLRNAVASGDVAGVVAAATTREDTFYEAAFGERVLGQGPAMSLDTVCWIASMTKPLVGAGVMQLVEQGRLDLDAPAGKVIPYLGEVQVLDRWDDKGEPHLRSAKAPVTLRNLLTHTSGFVYDIWDPDIARYTRMKNLPRAGSGRNIALQIPLAFDPGARWEYGIGIDWAGKMLEAVSGMRLGAYLRQNLFAPLGMDSTGFRISPEMRARLAKVHQRGADGKLTVTGFEVPQEPEFEPGGGGIYSTAGDYLRFARMILNGGAGNGNRVLRAETVARMSKNNIGNLRVGMLKTQNAVLSRDAEFFIGTPKTWGLTFMINEEQAPPGARRAASRGRASPTLTCGSTRSAAWPACTSRRSCLSWTRSLSRSTLPSRRRCTSRSAEAYSALIPAARITSAHRLASSSSTRANSSGLIPAGSAPSASNRSFTSAADRARTTSLCNQSITLRGVPLGAVRPTQFEATKPGTPASSAVGTPGRTFERSREVTASGTILPPFRLLIAVGRAVMRTSTDPVIKPVIASPMPRNGTCVRSIPADRLNSSVTT